MKLKVYKANGGATRRSVELDEAVFGSDPNDHAIWLDVRRIQAAGRQGTHKAKERGEVAGSTRKLYRQKGTGNSRAGSAKSPVRRSGGTTFGPRPRSYDLKVNRKTRRLARRSAITHKVRTETLRIVEDFNYEVPDTSALKAFITAHELDGKRVLVLTNGHQPALYQSGRNLGKVTIRDAGAASTLDVMQAAVVLLQEGAVESLTQTLATSVSRRATQEA